MSSTLLSRRKLGDKFQLRRSVSREASDHDNIRRSSSFDPDSSYASSNTAAGDEPEDKNLRAKGGGLNALGSRVRSMSTTQRKSQTGEEGAEAVAVASLPKATRSKSSLFEDNKRSSRSSRLFDALGFKSKAELAQPVTSPGLETENDNPMEHITQSPSRRPRLSVSGLSSRINRTSSYFSLDPTSPASSAADGGTSPGDFNLRSFRNVRRQESTSSYALPSASASLAASPLPMSSASQYMTVSPSGSRPESFLSAEDIQQHVSATSPRYYSPSKDVSETDLLHLESKPSSPKMESVRFQGGSISAGRFRKVTGSIRNPEDVSGTSTPTEGAQRSLRPSSPFMNTSLSSGQALAALEADMAKGRTTPLMFLHQGEQPKSSNRSGKDGPMLRQESGVEYQSSHMVNGEDVSGEIAPPVLPWMRDEGDSSQRRRPSLPSFIQTNDASKGDMSPLANVFSMGELRSVLPKAANGLAILSKEPNGPTTRKHHAMSASPTQEEDDGEGALPEDVSRRNGGKRWPFLNGATLDGAALNGAALSGFGTSHRRGESTPLVSAATRSSLPSNGHRRATSALNDGLTIGQSKADELISFHEKQAPHLSAAQSRTEIGARIAWPSPPCIKLDYFSQLTALHQHSLYEQHCKAAQHALAEYMRLMSGVVPEDAMTQPGPLFCTASSLHSRQSLREKQRRSSDTAMHHHSRSRSISHSGEHGSGSQSRRRSLTPALSKADVPVPPLPSESMLEKMEERRQSSRNGFV